MNQDTFTPSVGQFMVPQQENSQREALANYINFIQFAASQRPGISSETEIGILEKDTYLKIGNLIDQIRKTADLTEPDLTVLDRQAFKMSGGFNVDIVTAAADMDEDRPGRNELGKMADMITGHLVAADTIADRFFSLTR